MDTSGCLLCRIVAGELRVDRIVESEHALGVMNEVEALSRGHGVFCPNVTPQASTRSTMKRSPRSSCL